MSRFSKIVMFFVMPLLILAGCGLTDKKKGLNISIPQVEPVVRSAIPTSLIGGSALKLDGQAAQNPADIIKSRIFSPGPAEVLSILKNVDRGMAEIKARIDGKIVPCFASYEEDELVEKTPVAINNTVDFDGDGKIDLDLNFPQYLNCVDVMANQANAWRAFGKNTENGKTYWYIREGAPEASSWAGASAVRVGDGTNEAEVWMRVGKASMVNGQSVSLAHLKRSDSGLVEYTHTGSGVGYDCGLHMQIKSNLMYVKATVDADGRGTPGGSCESNSFESNKEYCIDASAATFTLKDQAECTNAGLSSSSFTLTSLTYTLTDYKNLVKTFTDGAPSTVAAFTSEDPPAE